MDKSLKDAVLAIEQFCQKKNIVHRFVGGVSYGGLLNKDTTYDVDLTEKTVRLHQHNPLSLVRTDGTIRDIDLIIFCSFRKNTSELKDYIYQLESVASKKHIPFPVVSVENAIYEPDTRNTTAQFVTAIEINKHNDMFLTFDDITQQISWESLEPWQVILEDGTNFTTRNPIADYYAYHIRAPGGIKPKDREKIKWLKNLAETVTSEGKNHIPAIDYTSDLYYGSWKEYMRHVDGTSHIRIRIKKFLLALYWQTIGTTLAHGRGLLRYILIFSNQFTGTKQ